MASRRRKKQRDPGVMTTQVDMATVYKNNQAEDKKLERTVIRLKKKENSEVVRCFSEIKHLHRQLADMNLERESMSHTFTEKQLDHWEKRRRRKTVLPKMASAQNSKNVALLLQNSGEVETNSNSVHMSYVNPGVADGAIIDNDGAIPHRHIIDQGHSDDGHRYNPSLSRRTSTVATATSSRNGSMLSKRHSFSNTAKGPQMNTPRESITPARRPRTSGQPLTRTKSCCAAVTSEQSSSLPTIGRTVRRSSARRRTITAFSLTPTMFSADDSEDDDLSSSAPAKLMAMKQDIKSRDVDLMDRIHDFLEKVSPNDQLRKKRKSVTKILYSRDSNEPSSI